LGWVYRRGSEGIGGLYRKNKEGYWGKKKRVTKRKSLSNAYKGKRKRKRVHLLSKVGGGETDNDNFTGKKESWRIGKEHVSLTGTRISTRVGFL